MAKKFLLSDDTINSYGTRIDMGKLKLDRFKTNPVMLYNHDKLIGRWDNITLEDGKLYAEPVFMSSENEPLAAQIQERVETEFLKGASIGINIIDVNYGEDGVAILEAEIFEVSIVDIPSNANALMLYDKQGNRLEEQSLELHLKAFKPQSKSLSNMQLSNNTLQILGLSGKPTETAIDAAVAAIAKERDDLLTEKQAALTANIHKLITDALANGKCKADERESLEKLGAADFNLLETTLNLRAGRKELTPKPNDSASLSAVDRSNWTFDDWRKKDPKGFLSLKLSNPELYTEILSTSKI